MMSMTKQSEKRYSLETERYELSPDLFATIVTDLLKTSLTVRERDVFVKVTPALVAMSFQRPYDSHAYFETLSKSLSMTDGFVLIQLIERVFRSFFDA